MLYHLKFFWFSYESIWCFLDTPKLLFIRALLGIYRVRRILGLVIWMITFWSNLWLDVFFNHLLKRLLRVSLNRILRNFLVLELGLSLIQIIREQVRWMLRATRLMTSISDRGIWWTADLISFWRINRLDNCSTINSLILLRTLLDNP